MRTNVNPNTGEVTVVDTVKVLKVLANTVLKSGKEAMNFLCQTANGKTKNVTLFVGLFNYPSDKSNAFNGVPIKVGQELYCEVVEGGYYQATGLASDGAIERASDDEERQALLRTATMTPAKSLVDLGVDVIGG